MNFDDLRLAEPRKGALGKKYSHNAFNYQENGYEDLKPERIPAPFSSHQKEYKGEYWDCKENLRASESSYGMPKRGQTEIFSTSKNRFSNLKRPELSKMSSQSSSEAFMEKRTESSTIKSIITPAQPPITLTSHLSNTHQRTQNPTEPSLK